MTEELMSQTKSRPSKAKSGRVSSMAKVSAPKLRSRPASRSCVVFQTLGQIKVDLSHRTLQE